MKSIYPDIQIIRALSDRPELWDKFYDQFIKIFGRSFKLVQSYYLFFEYLGFTKGQLELPSVFITPHFVDASKLSAININKLSEENILILDKNLIEIEFSIEIYIKLKLNSLKPLFKRLVKERQKRISSFKTAQELVNSLFGNIITLIENNFEEFVKYATTYLTWDAFCSINPYKIPLKIIRERQLGFWLQRWEQGTKLPFGKIIDDQSDYYKINFTSRFKNFEDMADSEMHTYNILGYEKDNEIHPVDCLTHPPKDKNAILDRTRLVLASIDNIQKTLKKEIPKFPGKIYTLDEKTFIITEINEPMFSIILEK
ncbi:MAG: hypothetical protein K1060chlam4_00607 [Candidatus Anoxychlamydiales bacterium]|nr:hypothetical protein [Candidatus Anoxychlamydiales bacterium]